MLKAPRAAEVDGVVASLVRWQPDKLFVEWQPEFNQLMADSVLEQHRATGPLRRRNEVYQLGIAHCGAAWASARVPDGPSGPLRRALRADGGLPRARTDSWMCSRDGRRSAIAPTTNCVIPRGPRRDAMSLAAYLQLVNSPASLASDHSVYLSRFARIGEIRTDLRDYRRREHERREPRGRLVPAQRADVQQGAEVDDVH